ncbi:uncharacterized protein AMSG_01588, partial [Thecamonas trahens ATCC 50062]
MLYGVYKQGLWCSMCGIALHTYHVDDAGDTCPHGPAGLTTTGVATDGPGVASDSDDEGADVGTGEDELALALVPSIKGTGMVDVATANATGDMASASSQLAGEPAQQSAPAPILSFVSVARLASLVDKARTRLVDAVVSKAMADVAASPSGSQIREWLASLGLDLHLQAFLAMYDSLDEVATSLDDADLNDMGIFDASKRAALLDAAAALVVETKSDAPVPAVAAAVAAQAVLPPADFMADKAARRRFRIVEEIMTTEETYASSLALIQTWFLRPLRSRLLTAGGLNMDELMRSVGMLTSGKGQAPVPPTEAPVAPDGAARVPAITTEEYFALFANLDQMTAMHGRMSEVLKERVASYDPATTRIGDLFATRTNFSANSHEVFQALCGRGKAKNKAFKTYVDAFAAAVGMNLPAFLIMPVQRIPRYILLLSDLIKHTAEDHPDYPALERALFKVKEVADYINRAAREFAELKAVAATLKGAPRVLVNHHRRLLASGLLYKHKTSAASSSSSLLKIFLFSDLWVEAKPAKKAGKPHKFLACYRLKAAAVRPDRDANAFVLDVVETVLDFRYRLPPMGMSGSADDGTALDLNGWLVSLDTAITEASLKGDRPRLLAKRLHADSVLEPGVSDSDDECDDNKDGDDSNDGSSNGDEAAATASAAAGPASRPAAPAALDRMTHTSLPLLARAVSSGDVTNLGLRVAAVAADVQQLVDSAAAQDAQVDVVASLTTLKDAATVAAVLLQHDSGSPEVLQSDEWCELTAAHAAFSAAVRATQLEQ